MSKPSTFYEPSLNTHTFTIKNASDAEMRIILMVMVNEASKLNANIDIQTDLIS